jgi:hypothetical protein
MSTAEKVESLKTLSTAYRVAQLFRFCSKQDEVGFIAENFNFEDEYLLVSACEQYAGLSPDSIMKIIINTIEEL